ncbi:MarR family transcriptional regulator [Halarcobacter sp.]|uniref:MarR family winged helix-turn-helix transcriptional regulator n=1 Tax=Halarcobacter sp. TaxID=2321133 RepID=UPI002AAB6383|nr:MarR family transcriptional regulator [Halarcobacter sp.]
MKKISLENVPGRMFHSISSKLIKRLEKEGKEFGLTTSNQFGILLVLSNGSLSQKEIADKVFSDEPTTTRTLERMIKNDLVIKQRSREDKRKQIVKITAKGEELLENVLPIVLNINKEIEKILDEDEYNQLIKIMKKIDTLF